MTVELGKVKLSDKSNPEVLFEELYRIKNMYTSASNKVKDEQLIPYVLTGSPSRYHSGANRKLDLIRIKLCSSKRYSPYSDTSN